MGKNTPVWAPPGLSAFGLVDRRWGWKLKLLKSRKDVWPYFWRQAKGGTPVFSFVPPCSPLSSGLWVTLPRPHREEVASELPHAWFPNPGFFKTSWRFLSWEGDALPATQSWTCRLRVQVRQVLGIMRPGQQRQVRTAPGKLQTGMCVSSVPA